MPRSMPICFSNMALFRVCTLAAALQAHLGTAQRHFNRRRSGEISGFLLEQLLLRAGVLLPPAATSISVACSAVSARMVTWSGRTSYSRRRWRLTGRGCRDA